ncbi:MAG: protein kinase, partial [Verrucomicrobiota bacterium]
MNHQESLSESKVFGPFSDDEAATNSKDSLMPEDGESVRVEDTTIENSDTIVEEERYLETTSPCPSSPSPAAPPFVLGAEVARGGIGVIVQAQDCKLDRDIAVKFMQDTSADEVAQHRFIQEARVLGRLEHPSIVPVHDLGCDESGLFFYTMKLVRGRTLQDIVDDLRAEDANALELYSLDRLLTIFLKVCDAIAFAHSENIIHRDLKPANVMVGEFGEVLVMDWGLAKILDTDSDWTTDQSLNIQTDILASDAIGTTVEGAIMGTPQYMSPEQANGEISKTDARSDIYSLGGILYTLLTLQPPVEGKDVEEVLEKVRSANLEATYRLSNEKVSNALAAVVTKALSLQPNERYQKVRELSADIEKWQAGFATQAEDAGLLRQVKLLIRRHKTFFATAAVALLILGGFSSWFVLNLRAKEKRAAEGEAIAKVAQADAEERRMIAEETSAKSSILLADSAYQRKDGRMMNVFLNQVPEVYRDADWKYLKSRSISAESLAYGHRSVAAHPLQPGVFVTGSSRGGVTIFDSVRSETLLQFKGPHKEPIVAISPDGQRIAVGCFATADAGIRIYDAKNGELLRKWDSLPCIDLEFQSGGQYLLQQSRHLRSNREGICLWDSESAQLKWQIHPSKVRQSLPCRFLRDVGVLATGHNGQEGFFVIGMEDGEVVDSFGAGVMFDFIVSRDGSKIYYLSTNGVLGSYDLKTSSTIFAIQQPRALRLESFLSLGADSSTFYAVLRNQNSRQFSVQLRDSETGTVLRSLVMNDTRIRDASVHPLNGDLFIAAVESQYRQAPPKPSWQIPTLDDPQRGFRSRFWSGKQFLAFTSDQRYWLANIPSNSEPLSKVSRVQNKGVFDLLAGSDLGTFTNRRNVDVVQAGRSGATELVSVQLADRSARAVQLSEAGNWLAAVTTVSVDRHLGVYDAKSGEHVVKLSLSDKPSNEITDFTWLGKSEIVGIGLEGGRQLSPNLDHLANALVKWEVPSGRISVSRNHDSALYAVALSSDGSQIAEGGEDRRVRIRDAETFKIQREFRVHDDSIRLISWHPTLPVLATASDDLTVRIWDVESGMMLEELIDFCGTPMAMEFSPTGHYFTVSDRQHCRIWEINPRKLVPKKPMTGVCYVRIEHPGGPQDKLTLTEVEVFSEGVNVAPRGSATQIHTVGDAVASRAIDGNRDHRWTAGSRTFTGLGADLWWEVELN